MVLIIYLEPCNFSKDNSDCVSVLKALHRYLPNLLNKVIEIFESVKLIHKDLLLEDDLDWEL
jgi:hypothetical protein